jgi:tRNA(Met) C34 N-acetyltransferase TmcA
MVDKVNQQVKKKLHQSLGKTGAEFKPKEAKYFVTAKRNNPRGRLQVTKNNRKKRARFPTIIMEYEKQELEDLLALEKPKKKKGISQVRKDLSLVTCYRCGNKGHYANECLEKYFRAPTEG